MSEQSNPLAGLIEAFDAERERIERSHDDSLTRDEMIFEIAASLEYADAYRFEFKVYERDVISMTAGMSDDDVRDLWLRRTGGE